MAKFFVHLKVNESLYVKDPQQTTLGKKILQESIKMIDEIGFESFTFKKLAASIESTEGSIYRYFENKHKLFVYLLNWYWEWVVARITFNTNNIENYARRLEVIIDIIVDTASRNTEIEFIDEDILHSIVVREGTKGYHSIDVDSDNKEGFFLAYKGLCKMIADVILEINPDFKYPLSVASMLIETANNNLYFSKHLPRLTDLKHGGKNVQNDLKTMLKNFAFSIILNETNTLDTDRNHSIKKYN